MEYIDQIHKDQIAYIKWVRHLFKKAHDHVASWEPRPMPKNWGQS